MLYYKEQKKLEKHNTLKNIIIVNNKSNKVKVGRYRKYYFSNGTLRAEYYYINNKLHNPNSPAVKWYYENGTLSLEQYYINDNFHNPNGPAYKKYYEDGTLEVEEYYIKGKLHNPNGPALKWCYEDGTLEKEEYWIDNEYLTKEQFEKKRIMEILNEKNNFD